MNDRTSGPTVGQYADVGGATTCSLRSVQTLSALGHQDRILWPTESEGRDYMHGNLESIYKEKKTLLTIYIVCTG